MQVTRSRGAVGIGSMPASATGARPASAAAPGPAAPCRTRYSRPMAGWPSTCARARGPRRRPRRRPCRRRAEHLAQPAHPAGEELLHHRVAGLVLLRVLAGGRLGGAGRRGRSGLRRRAPVMQEVAVGRRVEVPAATQVHHELAQQAERQHLDGHHDQQHAELQRRAGADLVAEELRRRPSSARSRLPDEPDDEADAAEEVERPGRVGGEELHRHQVEEAPPEAGPPELRRAVAALVVLDVELADAEAVPHGQHRDVAVQLAVHLEGVGQLAGHRLEPAVEVLAGHAGDLRGDAVVELRGGALDEPVVADRAAPGDEVEAARPRRCSRSRGISSGSSWPSASMSTMYSPRRGRGPGSSAGRLAGVAAQADVADRGAAQPGHHPAGAVGAPVVDHEIS